MNIPQILFICDFPPSNHQGGSILASRLLGDYPAGSLTIVTGTAGFNASPAEGRLNHLHILFPTNNETGRWGLGRLKTAINWLFLPVLTVAIVWQIKLKKIKVSITIAHGYFFIAAALAAWLTSTRLILIVHDDWVTATNLSSYLLKYFSARIFRGVARRADHVYAVSQTMQEMLKATYSVKSEVQFPATEPFDFIEPEQANHDSLRIVYSGICHDANIDGLNALISLLKSDTLREFGIASWELHLYSNSSPEDVHRNGWQHPAIKTHGWVSQSELRRSLVLADILFIPLSFAERQRYFVERSFPSKTADYLACGKPILIRAPGYSSLVEYAKPLGFAEVVEEPSDRSLLRGLLNICDSKDHRMSLSSNAQKAFSQNHDAGIQRSSFRRVIARLGNRSQEETISAAATERLR